MKESKELSKITEEVAKLADGDTAKAIGYAELIKYALIEAAKKKE